MTWCRHVSVQALKSCPKLGSTYTLSSVSFDITVPRVSKLWNSQYLSSISPAFYIILPLVDESSFLSSVRLTSGFFWTSKVNKVLAMRNIICKYCGLPESNSNQVLRTSCDTCTERFWSVRRKELDFCEVGLHGIERGSFSRLSTIYESR
jgi:hypothetical protein